MGAAPGEQEISAEATRIAPTRARVLACLAASAVSGLHDPNLVPVLPVRRHKGQLCSLSQQSTHSSAIEVTLPSLLKVFYHLGELDDALNYALGAGSLFDVEEQSEYVTTLVGERGAPCRGRGSAGCVAAVGEARGVGGGR